MKGIIFFSGDTRPVKHPCRLSPQTYIANAGDHTSLIFWKVDALPKVMFTLQMLLNNSFNVVYSYSRTFRKKEKFKCVSTFRVWISRIDRHLLYCIYTSSTMSLFLVEDVSQLRALAVCGAPGIIFSWWGWGWGGGGGASCAPFNRMTETECHR
jgi:hypothetical protein